MDFLPIVLRQHFSHLNVNNSFLLIPHVLQLSCKQLRSRWYVDIYTRDFTETILLSVPGFEPVTFWPVNLCCYFTIIRVWPSSICQGRALSFFPVPRGPCSGCWQASWTKFHMVFMRKNRCAWLHLQPYATRAASNYLSLQRFHKDGQQQMQTIFVHVFSLLLLRKRIDAKPCLPHNFL